MEAFRHDFLLLFLRSYFNDKCPERIIACKSASNARAQTSPLAGGFPFIHSHRKQTRSLSVRHYVCLYSKIIFSPEFNVAISVGMHQQKPKLAHMPTKCKSAFTQHNSIHLSHIYCPSTLVCIYLFIFGWGNGVEYDHFFFFLL